MTTLQGVLWLIGGLSPVASFRCCLFRHRTSPTGRASATCNRLTVVAWHEPCRNSRHRRRATKGHTDIAIATCRSNILNILAVLACVLRASVQMEPWRCGRLR